MRRILAISHKIRFVQMLGVKIHVCMEGSLVSDEKGYWRYRIWDYRIIADIQGNFVLKEIIRVS